MAMKLSGGAKMGGKLIQKGDNQPARGLGGNGGTGPKMLTNTKGVKVSPEANNSKPGKGTGNRF